MSARFCFINKRRLAIGAAAALTLLLHALAPLRAAAPGEVLWTFPVGAKIQSSAAQGVDGAIIFGADNGAVYALTPEGRKKWEFRTAGAVAATPVIGPDGVIYIAGSDRILYALLPDGREKWRVMPGSGYVSSPALGPDGILYAGSVFGTLFAIEPQGYKKWTFPANGNIISSPAISAAGVIYFGSYDTNFYAVNPDGSRRWYVDTGDKIGSSPAIGADGTLYFGSNDQYLHALSPFGERLWEVRTGGPVRGSPVVARDGTVYIGSDDRKLRAISPEARTLWEFATEGWIRSTPALAADGTIYFGAYDNKLYAVDAKGNKKWVLSTGDALSASPLLTTNGILYFGGWDGRFYAVQADAPLAQAPWPLFRANPRRTGSLAPEGRPPAIAATLPPPPEKEEPEIVLPPVTQPTFTNRATPPPIRFTDITSTPRELILSNETVVIKPAPSPARPSSERLRNDRTRPKITLRSPEAQVRITNPLLVITGTARDNEGLERIEYQINQGELQAAEGLGEWAIRQQLPPGTHRVRIRAVDLAGNVSDWIEVICQYVRSSPLLLQINGRGEVAPNLSRDLLEIGKTYTLTAKPERGWTFVRWTGGVNSDKPQLDFVMRSNLVLVANFQPRTSAPKEAQESPPATTKASRQLMVAVEGAGTVKPFTGTRSFTDGKSVTLTAQPAAGHRFLGWRGDVESAEAEINFLIQSNTTVTASFAPGPFVARRGAYQALIWNPAAVGHENTGLLTFDLDVEGRYQGRLQWCGRTHPVRGQFDEEGRARLLLVRQEERSLVLEISLTNRLPSMPDSALFGWVREGEWTVPFTAVRPHATLPATVAAGKYVALLMPVGTNAPSVGDGYLTLQVTSPNQVVVAGRLGDGTAFESRSMIWEDGRCPIYLPLYGGLGSLSGWLRFMDGHPTLDVRGQWAWFKPAAERDRCYPEGLALLLAVCGQRYEPTAGGTGVLPYRQGVLALSGADLQETVGSLFALDDGGRLKTLTAPEEKFQLRLMPATGLFEGQFLNPVSRKTTAFQGAVLPRLGWGSGFFLGGGRSGLVFLGPATNAAPSHP